MAGPAWAECTAPGCHDDLLIGLIIMAVLFLLGLSLVLALTVRLLRRGRWPLVLMGWLAMVVLLLGLAQL